MSIAPLHVFQYSDDSRLKRHVSRVMAILSVCLDDQTIPQMDKELTKLKETKTRGAYTCICVSATTNLKPTNFEFLNKTLWNVKY